MQQKETGMGCHQKLPYSKSDPTACSGQQPSCARGALSTQQVFAGISCSHSFVAGDAGEKEAAFSQTHANPRTLAGEKPMPQHPDSRERAKPWPSQLIPLPSAPSSLHSLSIHVPGGHSTPCRWGGSPRLYSSVYT